MKPYYEQDGITIYHADCREILPAITAGAVITDPPFNVGKDYGESSDALDDTEYRLLMTGVAASACRQSWVTPTNRLATFSAILGPEAMPVVVQRGAKGPKRWGWFDQFDIILMRGKPARFTSNLWTDIRLKGEGYFFRENDWGHPGYTPYPLIARLVGLTPQLDGHLCDPFLGTGTTLIAAKAAGVPAIGIELSERYCEIAARRLAQGVLELT